MFFLFFKIFEFIHLVYLFQEVQSLMELMSNLDEPILILQLLIMKIIIKPTLFLIDIRISLALFFKSKTNYFFICFRKS